MLGKIGDNAVILVAAILTICGVMLALMPWNALNVAARVSMAPQAQTQPQPQFQTQPGEIAVGIPSREQNKPATPKPKAR